MSQTLNIYKSYSFKHKDPVIDQIRTMVKDADVSYAELERRSRVSATTMSNWFDGPTRRPQSASIEAVGRALGYERHWVKRRNKR